MSDVKISRGTPVVLGLSDTRPVSGGLVVRDEFLISADQKTIIGDGSVERPLVAAPGAGQVEVPSVAALRLLPGSDVVTVVVLTGYANTGDGGGGVFAWDETSTTADNGGTIIAVTGVPVGRWLRIYSGALSVLWFGAVPDGLEMSLAFQLALNAAHVLGAGTVFVPTGTYTLTPAATLPIVIFDNTALVGDGAGSHIVCADNMPRYQALFSSGHLGTDAISNVQFSNLRFDQNAAGNQGAIVDPDTSSYIVLMFFNFVGARVFDCFFDTCIGVNTIVFNGGAIETNRDASIVDCKFRFAPVGDSHYDNSTLYIDCPDQIIDGNTFTAAAMTSQTHAVTAIESHTGPATISNNIVNGNNGVSANLGYEVGMNIVGSEAPRDPTVGNVFSVTGNLLSNVNHGIDIWSFTGYTMSIVVSDNLINVAQVDWDLVNCNGLVCIRELGGAFANCVFDGNEISFQYPDTRVIVGAADCHGIGISPTGPVSNVTITNNLVVNAPTKGIDLGSAGNNVSSTRVSGNTLVNAGCAENVAVQAYRTAIFVFGPTCDRVLVDNNVIIDDGLPGPSIGFNSFNVHPPGSGSFDIQLQTNRVRQGLIYDVDKGVVDGRTWSMAASSFVGETAAAQLGNGQWTGSGPYVLQGNPRLAVGQRLTNARLNFNAGGFGTITFEICQTTTPDPAAAPVTSVLFSVPGGATGFLFVNIAADYVIPAHAEVYFRVHCDNGGEIVYSVDVTQDLE